MSESTEFITIIRPSFMRFCHDACRAAALNHLLFRIAYKAKGETKEKVQAGEITWYARTEQITEEMSNAWGVCKVRKEVNALIEMGLIGRNRNPHFGADRTKYFSFGKEQCQKFLQLCQEHNICVVHLDLPAEVKHLIYLSNGNDISIKCICSIHHLQMIDVSDGNDISITAITKKDYKDTNKEDYVCVLLPQSETPASVHSANANAPHALIAPTLYQQLRCPVTYNEAEFYLSPHGPYEGLNADEVIQLAQKLWHEAQDITSQSSSEQEQEPEHHEEDMSVQPSYSHLQSETTLEEKESKRQDTDNRSNPPSLPSSLVVPVVDAGISVAHDAGMDELVLPVSQVSPSSIVMPTGTDVPPSVVVSPSVQANGLEDASLSVQVATSTATTKKPAKRKNVATNPLLECPLSKPEMNGTWNDEAVVQYTEYCNGVRYRDTERERQKKAAHAIHLDDTALTCADYQTAYDERNDEWWKTHKGKLHVAHMRGKEGATGIDRLHAMLDRAASRTAGTMDEVTKRRIDIVYDTLNKLKQEVMGDPEARFHRTAQDEAAIVSFLLEQKATPKQVRLAFCDMWNEKNHDGSYRWRKRLTVRTFCQQYESRIMALEGKSPLSASPESASASGKPVVHADALFRENYIQARNQAMQQRKAVR